MEKAQGQGLHQDPLSFVKPEGHSGPRMYKTNSKITQFCEVTLLQFVVIDWNFSRPLFLLSQMRVQS